MRISEYLNRFHVKHRELLIFFILLVFGVTSLSLSPGEMPRMMVTANGSGAEPRAIIANDVDDTGHKMSLDGLTTLENTIPWCIHFYAVPGADGTSLFVSTGQTVDISTNAEAEVNVGGAVKHHGMTYNIEESAYEVLIGGVFTPGPSTSEGTIGLSADLSDGDTVETPDVPFRRFFVPTTGSAPIVSVDNNLEMTLVDHSLTANAYALVMSINAIPGPVSLGHQLVGQPYSVRASGATVTSTKPMLLKLLYTDTILGQVDPHTLSILQWHPVFGEWVDLGGSLDDWIENSVSTTTDRFTVYALMSTPRWRDAFNDFTGLSEWDDNVTVLLPSGDLVLDGLAYAGTATSRAITPTVAINGWGSVTFTRTLPAGTSLAIDVLSADGTSLLSDVASGASLASIDPTAYPSLKLRATFSTDDLLISASLHEWTITWQPRLCKVHLPVILRQ